MKPIYLILVIFFGLMLSGCASTTKTKKIITPTPTSTTQKHKNSVKNPIAVTLYTGKQKPEKPYVVLGHESLSKYNVVGIKRQEANIKDSMRSLAAIQGGDAVIEIMNHLDSISYTVISYKKSPVDVSKTDKA